LSEAGVPAGLVGDVGDAIARADEFGLAPTLDLGDGEVRQIRHPVRYSDSAVGAAVRPPSVGEHDAMVQAWLDGPADVPLPRRSD
jgi:crotonobetainyl-CoA:carnitine CoA-transferase CaiB-like acyl-CoA transferase